MPGDDGKPDLSMRFDLGNGTRVIVIPSEALTSGAVADLIQYLQTYQQILMKRQSKC